MPSPSRSRPIQVAAIAAAWFLILSLLNIAAGGNLRATTLYAVPVVFSACHGIRLGFVFAAVGALSAWAGGSIPHPDLDEPLWIEGLWAFLKLSAIAVGTRIALHQVRNRPST